MSAVVIAFGGGLGEIEFHVIEHPAQIVESNCVDHCSALVARDHSLILPDDCIQTAAAVWRTEISVRDDRADCVLVHFFQRTRLRRRALVIRRLSAFSSAISLISCPF